MKYAPQDLYKAIVELNLRNDYILNFFAPAIVEVVKANNPKVRKFYKDEHPNKDGAVVVEKAYFYKSGIAETNTERMSLEEIKFKRALKKNDEYVCKSI